MPWGKVKHAQSQVIKRRVQHRPRLAPAETIVDDEFVCYGECEECPQQQLCWQAFGVELQEELMQ